MYDYLQKPRLQIHVIHRHVHLMLFVTMVFAHAYQNTTVIHTMAVALNAQQVRIVLWIKHVSVIVVSIHALTHAASMLIVTL